jgi:hypothetical protein
MLMLMNVEIPNEPFNSMARKGTAGSTIQKILAAIKPKSVYFTEQDGHRGAVLVIDMKEASEIPAFAEPWYLSFDAKIEFRIAMTPEDLGRSGLDAIAKAW